MINSHSMDGNWISWWFHNTRRAKSIREQLPVHVVEVKLQIQVSVCMRGRDIVQCLNAGTHLCHSEDTSTFDSLPDQRFQENIFLNLIPKLLLNTSKSKHCLLIALL